MLVNELRTTLEKYDNATLKEIIVALYKKIPKQKKEEGLDGLLQNFSKEKKMPTDPASVDFDTLSDEVVRFMNYANSSFYLAPNRYVSKEKRSKWRLEVKRFIKELLMVKGESSVASARLLAYIYEMLCYACNYYIFRTENPFSAVGYKQTELLRIVLDKLFYNGYDEKTMKTAVFVTLDSTVDRDTLNISLIYTLLDFLKTPDTIESAQLQCDAYRNEYDSYQAGKVLFAYSSKYDNYRKGNHCNYAVEMCLLLKFKLYEYDAGIAYFWKNYSERDQEIKLCYLLRLLDFEDMDDLWIREYEKAISNKIKPRDRLKDEYEQRKSAITDEQT